jgi:hypothetical protein
VNLLVLNPNLRHSSSLRNEMSPRSSHRPIMAKAEKEPTCSRRKTADKFSSPRAMRGPR